MSIKSLLLGSAAALVAVSGARAADAVVVAEPEPVEYVRVCDVYGTGFFYIPGTETCLNIGGYVRFDIRAGDAPIAFNGVRDKKDFLNGQFDTNDTYDIRSRFAVHFDARSETELGTLRGYGNLEFNYRTGVDANGFSFNGRGNGVNVQKGFIELGGLRVGKNDSFFSTFTNYAGNVILDDTAVPYGGFDTHQIIYTFKAGNGFTIAGGVEDGGPVDGPSPFPAGGPTDFTIDSYVPDVVAGVSYTAAWGGISVVGGYDSAIEEGAVKGRLDINATEQLSLFIMGGYSTNDVPIRSASNNFYGQWGGDYGLWGGGTFKLNEKVNINAQVSYDEDEDFGIVANVEYFIVPGFKIEPELIYKDNFGAAGNNNDSFGGVVRFQRNF